MKKNRLNLGSTFMMLLHHVGSFIHKLVAKANNGDKTFKLLFCHGGKKNTTVFIDYESHNNK